MIDSQGIGCECLLLSICTWPLLLFNLKPGVFKGKGELTYVPIEGGIVDPDVYTLLITWLGPGPPCL